MQASGHRYLARLLQMTMPRLKKELDMKKHLIIGLLGFCLLAFWVPDAIAHGKRFSAPDHYLNLSFFVFHPVSVGYKHLVGRSVYLTGNLDYVRSQEDLLFQAGAAYMIPAKILFFRFYGGGGMEVSRNRGNMYPYVMVGTNFWILYTEVVHPLQSNKEPGYRFGFSISF